MNPLSTVSRCWLGISQHPYRFLLTSGASFILLWSCFEPIVNLIGIEQKRGPLWLTILIAAGLLVGLVRSVRPTNACIRLANINCVVEIKFGDIFSEQGLKVIPVNRFFDGELGQLVSPNSLHGKFLMQKFQGKTKEFDQVVERELVGKPFAEVTTKSGKMRDFGIGTAIMIGLGTEKFILIPTAHTKLDDLKAFTDFETFWSALSSLWSFVRMKAGGEQVVVPLIGGGLSGLKLSHRRILDGTLLSIVYHSRERELGSRIVIVIEPSKIAEIDLTEVARDWRR